MGEKYLQLHIPIRNLSRFDRCLIIGGDYGDYLLIPQTLMYSGLYSGDDWVNRKQIFFYPNDAYVLVTACKESDKEIKQAEMMRNVLPVIYDVLSRYPDNSLVPHALDPRDMVPITGALENHSIKINPVFQSTGTEMDQFTRDLASLIRPYYVADNGGQSFLSQLLAEKPIWGSADLKRVIDLANHKLYLDHHGHMSSILGGLIIDFLDLDNEHDEFLFKSQKRWSWRFNVLKKIFSMELLDHIVDFVSDYLLKNVEKKFRYSRRYWEHSSFDSPQFLKRLKYDDIPSSVSSSDFLKSEVLYFTANTVSRYRGSVHNSILDLSCGRNGEEVYERNFKSKHMAEFEFVKLISKTLNLPRLSYYIEAHSSSRVGVKFLHLYQVVENMMTQGAGSERAQIKTILGGIYAQLDAGVVSKFVSEITLKSSGTVFSGLTPSRVRSDDIAISIYDLRCALVHSKGASNFIEPYSREEYNLALPYLELMNSIARILVET